MHPLSKLKFGRLRGIDMVAISTPACKKVIELLSDCPTASLLEASSLKAILCKGTVNPHALSSEWMYLPCDPDPDYHRLASVVEPQA